MFVSGSSGFTERELTSPTVSEWLTSQSEKFGSRGCPLARIMTKCSCIGPCSNAVSGLFCPCCIGALTATEATSTHGAHNSERADHDEKQNFHSTQSEDRYSGALRWSDRRRAGRPRPHTRAGLPAPAADEQRNHHYHIDRGLGSRCTDRRPAGGLPAEHGQFRRRTVADDRGRCPARRYGDHRCCHRFSASRRQPWRPDLIALTNTSGHSRSGSAAHAALRAGCFAWRLV